jgi:superfamily II DNA or RNA helicase
MLYIRKKNNNYIELESDDTNLIDKIEKYFTYKKEVYKENKETGYKNKKIYDITLLEERHLLPYGLFYELKRFIRTLEYNDVYIAPNLKIKGSKLNLTDLKKIVKKWNLPKPYYPLRDYQYKTILMGFNLKRLTIISPTSSGKTLSTYGLCKLFINKVRVNKRILIIVPRTQLVDQLYKDFEKYDLNNEDNIKKYIKMVHSEYDKIIEDHHKIIVGTWQSFQNFDPDFFKMFKYLFVDEVHNSADDNKLSVSVKKIIEIVQSCKNAVYRIGLTGSIFTEDEVEILKRKTIEGLYGRVKVATTSKYLQENKYVAKVKIKGVIFDYGVLKNKTMSYDEELKYYAKKMGKIDYIIKKLSKTHHNAIILFKQRSYGKKLYDELTKCFPNKDIHYVDGTIPNKKRLLIQKQLDRKDNQVVVGSFKTFGEGISINNIFFVYMVEDVLSKQVILQAIGRGMRLYKGKNIVIIYDLIDKLFFKRKELLYGGICYRHRYDRLKYYKNHSYDFNLVGNFKVKK